MLGNVRRLDSIMAEGWRIMAAHVVLGWGGGHIDKTGLENGIASPVIAEHTPPTAQQSQAKVYALQT